MADAFGLIEDDRAPFELLTSIIQQRRTSLLVDPQRPVPTETIAELCGLATWAPNHKRTWPWRFALFTGDGRSRLGETMVADMVDADFGDDIKRAKTATKYLRAPSILVAGCEPHANPMLDDENRDTVAAGVQNLLLGATALGLASFWSTPALTRPPKVLELCGFGAEDRIIGIIYLGWPVDQVPTPERPAIPITHVTG